MSSVKYVQEEAALMQAKRCVQATPQPVQLREHRARKQA